MKKPIHIHMGKGTLYMKHPQPPCVLNQVIVTNEQVLVLEKIVVVSLGQNNNY